MFLSDDSKCLLVWEFVDKGYLYSKVVCKYKVGDDFLTFEFSGSHMKKQIRKLHNFMNMTALRAETALERKLEKLNLLPDGILPRHEHDCLYQVYLDLGLDLGYIANPLKEL